MMKRFILLFLMVFYTLTSCDQQPLDGIIPFSFVNQDINLNLIQYQELSNIGGYIYINEATNAGYKGLIVYHEGNEVYRVFERACTFDPNSDCTPIVVDESDLFMIHECCQSTFNFNGNPTGGPASLRLLEYSTFVDGFYLKIRNN